MSKYLKRGAYHYHEFSQETPYRHHVLDLVSQIELHVDKRLLLPKAVEVGSGEGLILDQLSKRGFSCRGCDLDQEAVRLSTVMNGLVKLGSVGIFEGQTFDVALLCDVLEHVPDPIAMMAAARALAPVVVIAVPDRHDRHAIHEVDPKSVVSYMETSCKLIHQSRRHARHLMIFDSV